MSDNYGVYAPGKGERALVCAVFFIILSTAGFLFYGVMFFGVSLPVFYRRLMQFYCEKKAQQRRDRLLMQFRDFLYSLSASFATGRHMTDAMEEAEGTLAEIYGSESDMVKEVGYMLRRVRETGETDLQVLSDFAERSCLEDAEDFVQVFSACRETGGNLIQAVNRAAGVICDKINIETEIRTMVAQKKLEGRIIAFMPAGVILFLQIVSPEYLQIMYQTFAGRILMSLALAAAVFAFLLIERITDIEV